MEAAARHWREHGRALFADIIAAEKADGRRIIAENDSAIAFVPYFARYAYETYVAPKQSHQSIADLSASELADLAAALQNVLVRYDNLWQLSFPYVLALHQAPTDGHPAEGFHFHIQIHPPLRTPSLLKYLAGPEIGGGNFVSDTSPEQKAAELRACSTTHYKATSPGVQLVTTPSDFIEPLRRLHDSIRGLVVAACEERSTDELTSVSHEGAGDVIYAIDRISETALIEWFTREIAAHEPIVLIGEGLAEWPHGTSRKAQRERCPLADHRRPDRRHARPDVPKTPRLDPHRRRAQPRRENHARRY